MNAFLIFCKRHRSVVKSKYPHLENRSITKILGEWWAALDADQKQTYTELARQYKEAFMKANPNFKWYKTDTFPSHPPPQQLHQHRSVCGRPGHRMHPPPPPALCSRLPLRARTRSSLHCQVRRVAKKLRNRPVTSTTSAHFLSSPDPAIQIISKALSFMPTLDLPPSPPHTF